MNLITPWLLKRDLSPDCPLHPVSLSLHWRLKPLSAARMTLTAQDPEVNPGDFIRIHTPDGRSQIHRVTEACRDHGTGLTELRLLHGLCTLSDSVVFGRHDHLGLDTGGDTGAVITNGVIRVRKANLRQSPSYSAKILTQVTQDTQIAITGAKRSWYAVTHGSVKGWMSKACVTNTREPVLTLREVALQLMNTQPANAVRWSLGDFDVTEHEGISLENCNTLTALLSLPGVADGICEWRTDQSVTPWRLCLRQPESGVGCELRLGRNARSLRLTHTRQDLCSRLYPSGEDGLTIGELTGGREYVDTGDEDIVERILLLPKEQNVSALYRRACVKLSGMEGPRVMAECDALDLYPETHEPMDLFTPGKNCRLILPGGGHRILRVTEVYWPQLIRRPREITLTLAGPMASLAAMLNRQSGEERLI